MKNYIIILFVSIIALSCVEPFEPETQAFENVLVVDARLTDEEKNQQLVLSRTRRFEQEGVTAESNAQVEMFDNTGTRYVFKEDGPGIYLSEVTFAARSGLTYELAITTSNGKSYRSEAVVAPERVAIERLYVERTTNDLGNDGVGIFLDNIGSDSSKFYRYEYEETYKIIAPDWDPFEFDIIDSIACADGDAFEVGIKPRTKEQRVCFGSNLSKNTIQANTNALDDNELSRFQVRFIGNDNFMISHRYSIMVRQFVQTQEAYSYYQRLNDFSSSASIFSEIQPGFLSGNLKSETDEDEKVIGYFEVASVSSDRLFFDYADMFPNEPLPPYPINCGTVGNPPLTSRGYHCDGLRCDGSCRSPLIQAIQAGLVVFHATNDEGTFSGPGPYFTKAAPCGDCTKLGSNIVPDFWIEE